MVPEIQGATDRSFCHFGPFQPPGNPEIKILKLKKPPGDIIILLICTINDNLLIYDSRDMEHDTEFFVILDCFLPFYPPMDPENQNFEKMKKITEDIIILQTYMTVI